MFINQKACRQILPNKNSYFHSLSSIVFIQNSCFINFAKLISRFIHGSKQPPWGVHCTPISRRCTADESCSRSVCKTDFVISNKWRIMQTVNSSTYLNLSWPSFKANLDQSYLAVFVFLYRVWWWSENIFCSYLKWFV